MGHAVGTELKAAIRKASTWGTAVACGARNGLLILPHSIKKSLPNQVDDSLGNFFSKDADQGQIAVAGDLPAYLRYDGLDLPIALGMGTAGSPTYTSPDDTGTATAGGDNTLTDSAKSWTTDEHSDADRYVTITGGTGSGQTRKITSNTATQLTVDEDWDTNPSTDSTYEISDAIASHVYALADDPYGLFATFALYNQVNVDEYTTLKVTGFTISGQVGQPLRITFHCIAIDRITNSTTNTSVTFADVTYRETANRVLMKHGVIRMNAQDGAALDSDDTIYPNSFEFSFKRKAAGVYGVASGFDYIDEPTNDGMPDVMLKLDFPRYSAATPFTDWDSKNAKKLDMTFTGALLGGSTYRSLLIEMPNLIYSDVDVPIEAGILKNPVSFNVLGCSSAPTGMSTLTSPFRVTLVNGYGGDPLQAGNDC